MQKVITPTFDDQVFENRNKEFGAYFLRRFYSNHVLIAFAGSLAFVSIALSAPLIYNKYFKDARDLEITQQVEIDLEKVEIEEPVEEIPPPPIELPPPPPEIASVKFLPPEIRPDEEVKEEIATQDELKDAVISNENREGVKGDNLNEEIVSQPTTDITGPAEEEVLAYVPVQAEYDGGNQALIRDIMENITYPEEALKNNIKGDVWVQFTVNLDGSISDLSIYKGLGYGCDEEALKAVKKGVKRKFTPGMINGISKRSKRKVKIHFEMK